MEETILQQIYRQSSQVEQMSQMPPSQRPEYLRFTSVARQAMNQSELFKLQAIIPEAKP